jgi:ABC-type antimicrobial peptide transport system permease subunit
VQPEPDRISALIVRAAGNPEGVVPSLREVVRSVHPRLLIDVRTLREEIARDIARERMVAVTSAFFGALALLLVAVGIFGVASATVAQRTNELGIRLALGATRASVIRESLHDTMRVFAGGLGAGVVAAVVGVQLMGAFIADLLFGLTATDAVNIAAAAVVIVVVAAVACILPARHATRIDPLSAIRQE